MADPRPRPNRELQDPDKGKTLEQIEEEERIAFAKRTYRYSNGKVELPVETSRNSSDQA